MIREAQHSSIELELCYNIFDSKPHPLGPIVNGSKKTPKIFHVKVPVAIITQTTEQILDHICFLDLLYYLFAKMLICYRQCAFLIIVDYHLAMSKQTSQHRKNFKALLVIHKISASVKAT